MAKVSAFLRLLRFQYHHGFAVVILGAFCFSSTVSKNLIADVAFQYFSFGICLYGGIYVLNAITDADQDRNYPRKRLRPIPSGAISEREAKFLLASLWVIAFLSSYLYEGSLRYWPIYSGFIYVNLFYSLYLRKTPCRFLIGITCPMRLYLGAMTASTSIPWSAYGIALCFMCAVQLLKADLEIDKRSQWHLFSIVFFISGSILLGVWQYPEHLSFLIIAGVSHVIFIVIPFLFPVLGISLFGADVVHGKKERLPLKIFIALLRQKDAKGILIFFLIFIFASLNHFLIAVEDILLPRISSIRFEKVVFILGHPRSGTTYLHKALHGAPGVETSSLYDLWFASIILKRLGQSLLPLVDRITRHWSTQNHPIGIWEELEEHQWLLLRFKSIAIPYVFPSV